MKRFQAHIWNDGSYSMHQMAGRKQAGLHMQQMGLVGWRWPCAGLLPTLDIAHCSSECMTTLAVTYQYSEAAEFLARSACWLLTPQPETFTTVLYCILC